MPYIYRKEKKKLEEKKAKRNAALFALTLLLSTIVIFFCYYLFLKQNQTPKNKQLYFVDSKYKNIKSEINKQSSQYFDSIVEKPITKNDFVNKNINIKIKEKTNFFFAQSKLLKNKNLKAKQNISYQITLNNDNFLSLVIFINQDLITSHPTSETIFWTFDKKNNKILTISDLFENNNLKTNVFIGELRKKIIAENKIKNSNISVKDIAQATNPDKLYFIVKNEHIISFPFGKGLVGPQSVGSINIDIDFSNYGKFLNKNSLAMKVFDINLKEKTLVITEETANTNQNNIALTFDDGPGDYTKNLLLTLKKYKAKATFFVLGSRINRYSNVLKKIDQDGHEIGNHTFNHPDLTKFNDNQIINQLVNTNNAIRSVLPNKPINLLRPPYGAINQRVSNIAKQNNMSNILWSIDTRDWADRDSEIICNRATASARPGGIILMHDIHKTSVGAMECILSNLSKNGYNFVTISELFNNKLEPGKTYFSN